MKIFILLLVTSTLTVSAISQSTFSVMTTGTTPQMDSAIIFTTDIWSQYLNSAVPIKVNIISSNLTTFGPLAITFPNGVKDFAGAPTSDVWYATSLANSIAGIELNPGEFDMDIYVNSAFSYYLGLDGNPPGGQYDFVSLLLHEITHGLGGTSLSKFEANLGSFGMLTAADFVGFPISFQFPVLEGRPSVWDNFLVNGAGMSIADTNLFPNSSLALGSQFQSNNIFFSGPNATISNGGNFPRIFAPSPYENGSSLHHFNEASFNAATGNGLFTPYMTTSEVQQTPGPLLMAALTDIGWNTNLDVGIDPIALNSIAIYPNPSNGVVILNFEGDEADLKVVDLLGNVVVEGVKSGLNTFTNLSSGTYIIAGEIEGVSISKLIVIE